MTEENKSVKKFPNLRFSDKNGNDFPDWKFKYGNQIFSNISNKKHNSDLPILAITQDYGAIPRDLIDFKITVTDKSVESYKVVEVGDFIISLRSFQGGIEYSEYRGICSPAYIILRPNISIDRIFFKYYLKTPKYIIHLNRKLEGIRDGKMISYSYFSDIILPLPSIDEQNKVSAFLSLIESRIATQKKIIEQLETLMRANREKLFSQKLRFKDDGGNYFSDWSLTELKNVCSIIGGGTPDTQKSEFWNGNIQWFTPTEIKSNFVFKSERTISELGLKNSSAKILPKGSILLTTRATIGEVAIAQEECTTNQGFQSLIVKENCNNVFLFHWIKENKLELIKRANGSTFPEISKSEIEVIKILLPSINEQTKIANCLSSIQEKIDTERHILEKLDLQKKFLLANLFL